MNNNIFLSVVIPVYNEEDKIEKTLSTIMDYLKDKYPYEIIVVDDGSRDDTPSIVRRMAKNLSCIKIFTNRVNRGKGYALKIGMTAANGKYVFFTDADLSTSFKEIEKFLPYFEQGYDIVIGSRRMKESNIQIHQPFYREFMGKVYYWLAHTLIIKNITDFNCGFKGYRREVAHTLYEKQSLERWGFDVEILFLARKSEYKIKEIPVNWINVKTTKVDLLKDSLRSFMELIQIRLNQLRGLYDK